VCGDLIADGRKIVGGAQRRTRAGVLHQGSVQNLSRRIERSAFASALAIAFGRELQTISLDEAWLNRAQSLADSKYATTDWLRAR
jgi:lipoate-protein ligase A